MILPIVTYLFIGTILAYVAGGFVTSQRDRDLVVWCALFWPVSILAALVFLAAVTLLALFVGPIFLAANWQDEDVRSFFSDVRTIHLKKLLDKKKRL